MKEIFALLLLGLLFLCTLVGLRHLLRAGYLLSGVLRDAIADPKNAGVDGKTLRSVQKQMKQGIDEPDLPVKQAEHAKIIPERDISIPSIGTAKTAPQSMVDAINELYGDNWGISFQGISREQGLLILNATQIAWEVLNQLENQGIALPQADEIYIHNILATLLSAERYYDDIITMEKPLDTDAIHLAMDTVKKQKL